MKRASIVIFATHSLQLLPVFCERSIWLDHGRIMLDGPTAEVVRAYETSVHEGP
jgi:ABC-type polysaccharide/polyol phosphate transport system ATPase subunit